ncbi:hypothetical protein PoB_006094000 [Plakobranchus ocellatus]|uniref:Uncharacterized protein n=1 Tax=Plakobranchus ocellatus TaxID=259542 RepID=A0AAV4CRH6_9GAST|nr:hypothetical protein PoB_006094000 [Plakobranchus ocellatus]
MDSNDSQWLLAILICFLSVVEIVMALISASVTCCCAHVRGNQVHVVVNTQGAGNKGRQSQSHHPGRREDDVTRWSSTPHHSNNNNVNNNNNNHNSNAHDDSNTHSNYQGRGDSDNTNKMTLTDIDPEMEATGSGVGRKPRVEIDENVGDSFAGSYPQLKKWALPNW